MPNVVRQITESMEACICDVLGAEYKLLEYFNEIEKNSYKHCPTRYGVLPQFQVETDSVTKQLTFIHTFEIVLTKGYCASPLGRGDGEAISAWLDLNEQLMDIYKRLENTKAGLPSRVLNVTTLSTQAPEYLTDDKVAVLRANVDVLYRYSLI